MMGLHAAAVAAGVTLDLLRKRLAANPELQRLIPRVGRVFVLPLANLPRVRAILTQRPTPTAGAM